MQVSLRPWETVNVRRVPVRRQVQRHQRRRPIRRQVGGEVDAMHMDHVDLVTVQGTDDVGMVLLLDPLAHLIGERSVGDQGRDQRPFYLGTLGRHHDRLMPVLNELGIEQAQHLLSAADRVLARCRQWIGHTEYREMSHLEVPSQPKLRHGLPRQGNELRSGQAP